MTHEEYYTAPSQEIFEDIKRNAIAIWKTYDDTYGYASEKTKRIEGIQNIEDNAWYIAAMFDHNNQQELLRRVEPVTRVALLNAMNTPS